MTPEPDRSTFEALYAGQAPWDIGKPQQPFLDVADRISGSFLVSATKPASAIPE